MKKLLQEFKELILEKLDKARKDYDLLKGVISALSLVLRFRRSSIRW